MSNHHLDTVGYWAEPKLLILEEYAKASAQVLKDQPFIKHIAYIDAFAGAGTHVSKTTGELIHGSPARALAIRPRFTYHHFIEMEGTRARRLRQTNPQPDVTVCQGDCNEILLGEVFPECRYEDFRRPLPAQDQSARGRRRSRDL